MTAPAFWTLEHTAQFFSILEAIAVIGGAIFTVATVNAWRAQNLGKRKVELAERALLDFYEMADALEYARRRLPPLRECTPAEDFEDQRSEYYNKLQFILSLDVSSLAGQRPMFRVYFGSNAAKPFDAMIDITRELALNAREVFATVPAHGSVLQDKSALLNILGWGDLRRPDATDRHIKDATDRHIKRAVEEIEAICKPVLEGRR